MLCDLLSAAVFALPTNYDLAECSGRIFSASSNHNFEYNTAPEVISEQ